jgi:hypothetical protein
MNPKSTSISRIYLLSFMLFCVSCKQKSVSSINKAPYTIGYSIGFRNVPIDTLIANPKRFNGQRVRLNGYWHIEFEGDCLYIHKRDYIQGIARMHYGLTSKHLKKSTASKALVITM